MKLIPLTRGLSAIVDDDDYEWLSKKKWHAAHRYGSNHFVAARNVWGIRPKTGKRAQITTLMHREILGLEDKKTDVDHINGCTLDNRRANLRPCKRSENCWNQGKRASNKTGFKGVFKRKSGNFAARIGINLKQHWLGTFPTPEEAALAYDNAAKRMQGDFARFNLSR